LDNLLLLSDKASVYATVTKAMRTCHGCDKKSTSLIKCSKCGFFWYCNKVRTPLAHNRLLSDTDRIAKLVAGVRRATRQTASFCETIT
jgi:hypothetical protein